MIERESPDESYERRLQYALDWANRDAHGQFLLQHVFGICGMFDTAVEENASSYLSGRRSVAVQLMADIRRNRSGVAILKTAMCNLIDEMAAGDEEDVAEQVE
jgi:hypothetical protein